MAACLSADDFIRCERTVFVLHRSDKLQQVCGSKIDLDFLKTKGKSISKSLWACNVESVFEYTRIIYDIFAGNAKILLIVAGKDPLPVNSWTPDHQKLSYISPCLALLQKSDTMASCETGVQDSLPLALSLLATDRTKSKQSQLTIGRIIILTSLEGEEKDAVLTYFNDLIKTAITTIDTLNSAALDDTSGTLVKLDGCEILLLNVQPVNSCADFLFEAGKTMHHKNLPGGSIAVCSSMISTHSAHALNSLMMSLVQKHFGLVCSTVTGIPMKEEQGAGTSTNYDVDLFHKQEVHSSLLSGTKEDPRKITFRDGIELKTVLLKWCSPKPSVTNDHLTCHSAGRVSPVDVNSRPSACLTNFILSGRSVLLELHRKSGKIQSHMLRAHDTDIFIHSLLPRSHALPFGDDIPSITEGLGGKVNDYRFREFRDVVIRNNTLAPASCATTDFDSDAVGDKPIKTAEERLKFSTLYWPVSLSESFLTQCPSKKVHMLLQLLSQPKLSPADQELCMQTIDVFVAMEKRGDPIAVSSGTKSVQKREESYRQLWQELRVALKKFCSAGDKSHKLVYQRLLSVKFPTSDLEEPSFDILEAGQKRDVDMEASRVSKKIKLEQPTMSLLEMWIKKNNESLPKRPDFAGRVEHGAVAPLYTDLIEEVKTQQ